LIGAAARRRISLLLLGASLVSAASPAFAAPKRKNARAAFDRGIAAYKKEKFADASAALARSFDLERDVETLFAWAQSERKLDHCDKAVELYEKILAFDLPPANREAVNVKLAECRTQIDTKPAEPVAVEPPRVEPPRVEPTPQPAPVVTPPPSPPAAPSVRHWYKDPIALTLLGVGIAGAGAGTALLLSASSLDSDSKTAFAGNRYDDSQHFADQAKARGTLGLITVSAGGALIAGGLLWIALRDRGDAEPAQPAQTVMTGWMGHGGGGLAVVGAF
jgi:tetratricopeptide (TPR) repeat protein